MKKSNSLTTINHPTNHPPLPILQAKARTLGFYQSNLCFAFVDQGSVSMIMEKVMEMEIMLIFKMEMVASD